jgi:hypothetical protein
LIAPFQAEGIMESTDYDNKQSAGLNEIQIIKNKLRNIQTLDTKHGVV